LVGLKTDFKVPRYENRVGFRHDSQRNDKKTRKSEKNAIFLTNSPEKEVVPMDK